jgi:hypothetical protein
MIANPKYYRAYYFALSAVLLAIVVTLIRPQTQNSALLLGDYPAFYTLGKIVLTSQSEQLYNLALQTKIQTEAWVSMEAGVLISVYPPIVAILMTPFAALTPTLGKFAFTVVSLLALFSSYIYLLKQDNSSGHRKLLLLSLIVTNPFILIGSLGGQNTSFSLAIVCLSCYLLNKRVAKNEILAGLAFSLWLFKPQFGLLILPLLWTLKLWRCCLAFLAGSLIHYLAGATLLGPDWPLHWLEKISFFASVNYFSNQDIHTSIVGLLQLLNIQFVLISQDVAQYLTWPIVAAIIIGACFIVAALARKRSTSKVELCWLYIASIPMIAPQTQFYDIGISAFALLVICIKQNLDMRLPLISIIWALSWISISLRPILSWLSFPLLTIFIFLSCLIILLRTNKRYNDELL